MTRSKEEIGAGLAPARAARPIGSGERIHVVGAAGAGASAAALLAHHAGARASGCDPGGPSPYTASLESLGIPVAWEHDASHVASGGTVRVDRLAVTKALTSVHPDHPELLAARAAGVPVEAWQQVVADAAVTAGARLVAVAGTHGKSTSTGWLVHVLVSAGRDPSGFVGAALPPTAAGGVPATARWGRGDMFVVEADEYAGNFDPYRPDLAVLLNAEWDHPDVFADEEAVLSTFEAWIRGATTRESCLATAPRVGPSGGDVESSGPVPPRRRAVMNVGDRGAATVAARLMDDVEVTRVALEPVDEAAARLDVAGRLDGEMLVVSGIPGWPGPVRLRLPGRHNAANAICVAAAAAALGLDGVEIAAGLATFPGVGRRMELKGEPRGVTVIDDYAHHPTAIAATIAAVRARFPGRPVWAVYEPLTYHRTAALLDPFADVLATADHAVVAEIHAGRDPDRTVASAAGLASAVAARGGIGATAPGTAEETADHLADRVRPGDVVLVMGGGRSYVIAERLVRLLEG